MRYSRVLSVVALFAALGLAVVVLARPTAPVAHPVRAAARIQPGGLKRALQQELQQFLVTPRGTTVWPPRSQLAVPGVGGTCFVAGGSCSLTPCVIPVQRLGTAVLPAASVVRPACPTGAVTPPTFRVTDR